jgi:hypothetical protein
LGSIIAVSKDTFEEGRVTPMVGDIKYSFTGHETFPFRYTWLTKAVQCLVEYRDLFTREDATVILGVGKNMVRSIRHWSEAVGIVESPSRGEYQATELGNALLGPEGWDPFLENPGTLWLLHWQLVSRWERASTWYLAFTRWAGETITRDQLVAWLMKLIEEESPTTRSTRSSLKRDVDTFLRMYTPSRPTRTRPLEETFDCPLVELGLMAQVNRGIYKFVRGAKPTLPNEIVLYAVLDFWNRTGRDQNTLAFETLLYAPGGPGSGFKLSENALALQVEQFPEWGCLRYDDTAGMRILLRSPKPISPLEVLERYYGG